MRDFIEEKPNSMLSKDATMCRIFNFDEHYDKLSSLFREQLLDKHSNDELFGEDKLQGIAIYEDDMFVSSCGDSWEIKVNFLRIYEGGVVEDSFSFDKRLHLLVDYVLRDVPFCYEELL
jgi:hypothetical protein